MEVSLNNILVPEPIEGIRQNVSWDDYLQFVGLNPSTIVYGLKSLRHLMHAWIRGGGDSPSKQWGRALHCLLFEPREFENRYVKCGMVRNRRHKEYQDFLAENEGKEPLTVAEYDAALTAAECFLADGDVQELIDAGQAEVTLLTAEQGMQCKGRVDWLRTSVETLVDLKSVRNIETRAVSRDFYKYHYDVKLGLYQRAIKKLTGRHWPVKIIWVENQEPYDVAVMPIDDAVLDRGARKGLEVISKVRDAIEQEYWPGVGAEDFLLYTPAYEMDDDLEGAEEYKEAA